MGCDNEHRLNLKHKANRDGFSEMFNEGETELRAIAAHNVNEDKVGQLYWCLVIWVSSLIQKAWDKTNSNNRGIHNSGGGDTDSGGHIQQSTT